MDDDGLGRSRQFNRLRLLRTLLSEPAQSRAELGQGLGVSRATITALLTELEHAGMVEQQFDATPEERRRSIGRPPLQISLSPTAAYAVGLDFGHRHVRAAVCDLAGEIVADGWSAASVDDDPAGSLDLAQRLTGEVLADAGVDVSRVIGVGAGFAAPVNPATGSIYAEDILPGWSDIEPAAELEARLGLPVLIDNGANAGAMGEHLFGAGRGVDHMAYVRLSAGVGLGLILGGSPYRGANGLAGELGHISFGEDGTVCRCGNRGCVETMAGPVAVAELMERSRHEPISVARLLELVRLGDRGARRAVADAGTEIGKAIAATVNLLNPQLVVIGGELSRAGDVLLDPIREAVSRRAIAPASASVKIVQSMLAERGEVLGAAAIQLAQAPQALARQLSLTAHTAAA